MPSVSWLRAELAAIPPTAASTAANAAGHVSWPTTHPVLPSRGTAIHPAEPGWPILPGPVLGEMVWHGRCIGVGADPVLPDLPGALDRTVRLERRHLDADGRRAVAAGRQLSVARVAGADRCESADRAARPA